MIMASPYMLIKVRTLISFLFVKCVCLFAYVVNAYAHDMKYVCLLACMHVHSRVANNNEYSKTHYNCRSPSLFNISLFQY